MNTNQQTTVNTIQAGIRGTKSAKVQGLLHQALGAYIAGDAPAALSSLQGAADLATGRTAQVMAMVAHTRITKGL
jgi:hypothetical protein